MVSYNIGQRLFAKAVMCQVVKVCLNWKFFFGGKFLKLIKNKEQILKLSKNKGQIFELAKICQNIRFLLSCFFSHKAR